MFEWVVFAEFDWNSHIFINIKTKEWDLKVLLFNFFNCLVSGSVQTYILEVGAYVCLKRATAGIWEGRFCWIWLKISLFLKYKNGGVGPTIFTFWLLKWSCLRLSTYIMSGSRCMRVSETSHHMSLTGSFWLNLTENITFFKILKRRSGT